MNIKELQAFISVYDNRSITKAAERLYVSQPTLTRIIKKIEEDTGTELFKRTIEGIIPTVAGDIYNEHARKMIELYRNLEHSISLMNEKNSGKLTIGTTFFLGAITLPVVLSEFNLRYPNVKLEIIEGNSFEIEAEIVKGIVDVGIIHLPISNPNLEVVPIGHEKFLVALSKDDALNELAYDKGEDLKYIDVKSLKNRQFILNAPNQRTQQEVIRICKNAGFVPNVKYQTRNLQTIVNLVSKGLAVSLIPSSYPNIFDKVNPPNYYNIEPELKPEWPLAVIHAKNLAPPKGFVEFVDICKSTLPKIYNY